MKGYHAAWLLGLLSVVTYGATLSPISRVVQLLNNLSKQIEAESKKEEDLFETYMCWGKKSIDAKTASNTAAESRIDMLKQYIADVEAGRVEFTSERQDLEKEIEELTGDLELSKNMREQENKDFLVAEAEMEKAETALTSAIGVLEEATKAKKAKEEGLLMALKSNVNQGFAARAAEGASLNFAVQLGEKFLTKGDAFFLRRLLTGEVPTPDWKKLNRKATFKMKYKARSDKIQSVLNKLLSTFQKNLQDARDKEAKALESYEALKAAKEEQLSKAQESLTKMEKEMGARGMSKADAENEVSALEDQVLSDKQFITDTEAAMATKKQEWKDRSTLRAGELKAISEAVAILSAGDAKDNFKKSFASQGFFFLQTNQKSTAILSVRQQIKQLAQTTHDSRLFALLGSLTTSQPMLDAVVKSIDNLIEMLKEEEEKDLSTKEDCEKVRMEDIRSAMVAGRAIDDLTDTITRLTGEIKDLNTELETTKAELKAAQEAFAEATKIRGDEAADWEKSDKEDELASQTVADAISVLDSFYKENGLMLAQKGKEAPAAPPPPATWEGEYKGKTGEATGILGILKLCQQDIDKDRSTAKTAEDAAIAAYKKLEEEFNAEEKALQESISDLEGQIGGKEEEVSTAKGERNTKSGELKATMTKIANANSGCEYIEVNYPVRVKNRQLEIDGLVKAKAILSGAKFTKPADENREVKPGDALLQRTRRH